MSVATRMENKKTSTDVILYFKNMSSSNEFKWNNKLPTDKIKK